MGFGSVKGCIIFLVAGVASLAGGDLGFGELRWGYQTGDSVASSPVLDAQGNVYFGSWDGYVYALDGDGQLRWRYDTGDWVDSSPALSPDQTVLYVGSWSDRLVALDTASGALRWSFATDSLVYASPAVAEDGTIYCGSSDGFLYALGPDGALEWEFEVGGELDSSPAIDGAGRIFVGSDSGLVTCLSAAGAELWTWEVPWELGSAGREYGITSSPMLTSDGQVLVGSLNYFVYALDAASGGLRWKHETGGALEGSLVEGMGRSCVVAGRDGYVYSFSWDGDLNWKTFVGSNYYSTPCVDGLGRIYVGALKGEAGGSLLALSWQGSVLWRTDFDGFVDSSPALGLDGAVYVGNNDGRLYAVEGGDKLASLGWSSFRGGANQRRSLQGYTDLTAAPSSLTLLAKSISGTDRLTVDYLVSGGGPVPFEIRAMGSGLQEASSSSAYGLSLLGASGEMARAEALTPLDGGFDGRLRGWLEPGTYRIDAQNQSQDAAAFFLEIRIR